MRIEHMKEFIVLAHYLNFTAAARALYMSQPTLTAHVNALEAELGAELIDRTKQQIELTPIGREFLKRSNALMSDYDAMIRRIKKMRREQAVSVRIRTFVGHRYVDEVLERARRLLLREHPEIKLEVLSIVMTDPLQELVDGRIDLSLLLDNFGDCPKGVVKEFLQPDPLKVIVPRYAPLARQSCVHVADLEGQTVFVPGSVKNDWMCRATEDLLERLSVSVELRELYYESIEDLFSFDFSHGVYLDSGYAMRTLSQEAGECYVVLPFAEQEMCLNNVVVYREDADRSVRCAIDALKEAMAQMRDG